MARRLASLYALGRVGEQDCFERCQEPPIYTPITINLTSKIKGLLKPKGFRLSRSENRLPC